MASRLGTEALYVSMREQPTLGADAAALAAALRASVQTASDRIARVARDQPESARMGTTATVIAVAADTLVVAQVGDSRAYLLRRGALTALTKDQTLSRMLMESGQLTPEEAERFDGEHIILQALGSSPKLDVAITTAKLFTDDVVLLCSDGLTGPLTDDEIARILRANATPERACEVLNLPRERGGRSGQRDVRRAPVRRLGACPAACYDVGRMTLRRLSTVIRLLLVFTAFAASLVSAGKLGISPLLFVPAVVVVAWFAQSRVPTMVARRAFTKLAKQVAAEDVKGSRATLLDLRVLYLGSRAGMEQLRLYEAQARRPRVRGLRALRGSGAGDGARAASRGAPQGTQGVPHVRCARRAQGAQVTKFFHTRMYSANGFDRPLAVSSSIVTGGRFGSNGEAPVAASARRGQSGFTIAERPSATRSAPRSSSALASAGVHTAPATMILTSDGSAARNTFTACSSGRFLVGSSERQSDR